MWHKDWWCQPEGSAMMLVNAFCLTSGEYCTAVQYSPAGTCLYSRSTLLTNCNALPQRNTICCYLMVIIAMMRQANHCHFPYILRPRGLLCEFGCTGVYCSRLLQATSLLPQNCQLSSFIPKLPTKLGST